MNLLIVEDDKGILEFLKTSLKSEGFVVDTSEDGAVGAHKVKTHDYDLVLLDIMLPHKTGREICAEIRAEGKKMPILILSVKGEIESKVDLFEIGADDYLVKPFSYAELLARIKVLMRRPLTLNGGVLQVDDLVLDTKGRTVTRDGKSIHLTPKEFFLLEYFMRNRGKVLSRQAILEHVWDMNADPFTNTIETHVLNLRKKIGDRHKRELIQSVSGTGYKIV